MWTQNRVLAAPVVVSKRHLELAEPQAVVINSGVANAATGERGYRNAAATAEHAASLLGLDTEQVLVLSTGVIGRQLPMDRLLPGVDAAVAALDADGGHAAAQAIMTTDTVAKETVVAGDGFTVGGMAKGAGMIHPDLATMLAVLTTDYPLAPGEARELLRPAVDTTFNAISVDGDCSTNDLVLLLANGASGVTRSTESDAVFAAALQEACAELSRQIVADGEGATVLAEITVEGAVDEAQAKAIARRIATSPLVKTALFGHDANWGRVLMAAGSAPWNGGYAEIDPDRATLLYNDVVVFADGLPTEVEPDVSGPSCTIALRLGLGAGGASYLTSDLSVDYVRINGDYRS
jgi:glutamate N-acetyltransferase/amino-acid N-acetyltransferase